MGEIWRKLELPERLLLFSVAAYFMLAWVWPGSAFTAIVELVTVVLAFIVGIHLLRRLMRGAIWRLRNRLMMTYLFIGVVPVVLALAMAALSGYLLASRLSVYLVNSELDRRVEALAWLARGVATAEPARRADMLQRGAAGMEQMAPGLAVVARTPGGIMRTPADSPIAEGPSGWGDTSGIVLRDGRYWMWAHVANKSSDVTVVAPLSRAYLSDLVRGLGNVSLFMLSGPDQKPEFQGQAGDDSVNRLPPAENDLDVDVRWAAIVPVAIWDKPGSIERALLYVHTRPSALYGILFDSKFDLTQNAIPVALIAVGITFLIVELVSLIIGVSLARTITSAVHDLYEGTQRVMRGDFSHRIKVAAARDQLADLGSSFNSMTENLERLLAVAKEKERLQAEIEIAREVQEQLYPKAIPDCPTLRLTATCEPARIVSGDYYDFQTTPGGCVAIAMGDVAGKGISAALLMATIQAGMRMELREVRELAAPGAHVAHSGISTARVVSELNQQLHATTPVEKFATLCFGVYDHHASTLTYTNAGHLPPVLVRNGQAQRLDVNGMVVGAFSFAKYDESRVHLESGDLLAFFTDGITEPQNEYDEMFGEDRLIDLLVKNAGRDEREISDIVIDAVKQWTGSPELQDDMTLLLARRT